MPYKGSEVSMVLIAPRSADGLAGLEKQLTSANVRAWVGKLRQRAVHVFVPRFKLETKYALEKPLRAMGMVRARFAYVASVFRLAEICAPFECRPDALLGEAYTKVEPLCAHVQ